MFSSAPFRFCCAPTLCVTPTLSLLSPVPSSPHVTPFSVSPVCFVTARQSFFSGTKQHQNSVVTVENGCVFFSRVGLFQSVRWLTVTKRLAGGLPPPPHDNEPDTWGGGSMKGPASQKALLLLIKRLSFRAWKGLLFSTSPLLSPSSG